MTPNNCEGGWGGEYLYCIFRKTVVYVKVNLALGNPLSFTKGTKRNITFMYTPRDLW